MTESENKKRPRLSQREIDIMTRMSTRDAGLKPKYRLKDNYTPLELKTFNKWRRIMRIEGDPPIDGETCAKCGQPWPEWFFVSHDEWERYVEPDMRDKEICRECYDTIKAARDNVVCDDK